MNYNLPQGWRTTTIGEIRDEFGGSVQTGPFGSQLHASDYQNVGVPVVMPQNLGQNKISQEGIARVGNDDWKRLSQHHLKEGDIILPRRGDISRYAYVTKEYEGWLCGTGCIKIRLNKEHVETKYLAYYWGLPSTQAWLFGNAVGTTMLNLNSSIVRSVPIVLPPLSEQKRIAEILGALDDKIELNRRMNRTLEAMARALFQSWFVDFDPVHVKARGDTPYGMDDATAALFPNSFEETALGLVPRGWRVKPLDKIANFLNGLALQKYPPIGDDYLPVIKIRELRQGFTNEGSDKAGTYIGPDYIIEDGDVLFSWSGSLLVDIWCGGQGALNQHLFKVTSAHYPKWFYYLWTQYHLDEFVRIAANKATTMGHIQRQHLSSALTVVPSPEIIDVATKVIGNLLNQIISNHLENRRLINIRDTFLPKLVSGEIQATKSIYKETYFRPAKMVAERSPGNTYRIKSYWNNRKESKDDRSPSLLIRWRPKRLRTEGKPTNELERNPRAQRALSPRGSGVRRTRRT